MNKKEEKAQKGATYDSDDEVEKSPLSKGMFDTFVKNILSGANKNAGRKIKEEEEVLSDDEFITPLLINEDLKNHLEFYGPNKNADTVLEQIELFIRLHREFESGRLRKNLISHYIDHMMSDFLEMKRVIEHNDQVTAKRYLV